MLASIARIDRRWIYLLVALAVAIPLGVPLNLPVTPSEPVKQVFAAVDAVPAGSTVWLTFDYYATTRVECDPTAEAVARQLFRKGCKIVSTSTIPDGALISRNLMERVARDEGKKYGEDYAVMGYLAGSQIAIKRMCDNFKGAFPQDVTGKSLDSLAVTKNLRNYRDIALVFAVSDNKSLDYYAIVAHTQYGLPVAGSATAVMVPELYSYVNSGQLLGLVGGLRGAAEYEQLMNIKGLGTRGMDAQSVVHLLIVCLIIVSNAAYFAGRPRARRG